MRRARGPWSSEEKSSPHCTIGRKQRAHAHRRRNQMGMLLSRALALAAFGFAATLATAQDCKSRGDLDANYCDDNGDMVADTPKDPKKLKTPSTLVFTYTPVEDPAVYEKVFKPF